MPRVIHFEFPADDPERAVKFYEQVFGWQISNWGGPVDYWLAATGPDDQPGINGAIARRQNLKAVCNTIDVPSVDDYLQRVVAAGGQAITPKMSIPGVGYMAYCTDTEGTVFGIMQSDPSAQ